MSFESRYILATIFCDICEFLINLFDRTENLLEKYPLKLKFLNIFMLWIYEFSDVIYIWIETILTWRYVGSKIKSKVP